MSINERLNQLYDEWEKKHTKEQLKRHGLVHETTYTSTSTKLKIVLMGKELNCQGNPAFDMIKFLNHELEKGSKDNDFERPTKQAGLWAYGILTGFQEDYYELDHNRNAAIGLKSIGWTNLSKICGGGKANHKWKDHADKQRDLTKEELKIMDPQLILCSGEDTYGLMTEMLGLERKLLLNKAEHRREISYSIWPLENPKCLYLDFYHHAATGFYEKWYWILEEVYDKCKCKGLFTWI